MKPRVLYILQNAWHRDAIHGERWDGPSWEAALWQSMTGKRLREMIPRGIEVGVMNATPLASNRCDDVLLPNPVYVVDRITQWRPHVVVLLGGQAKSLLRLIRPACITAPHPCYRQLSKGQTGDVAEIIRERAYAEMAIERWGAHPPYGGTCAPPEAQ